MSTTPTSIQIAPLDFDAIRADLKRFLQNQSTFTDYNFEGSTLALLLDILAYDAYYHGWYTNFAVNETFLQTAQIRNSVVAAARQVGYVPRSTVGSLALVDLTVGSVNTAEGSITVSKYTPFSTTVAGQTYTFYTLDDYSQYVNGSSNVVFTGVELYEGTLLTQTFTVNSTSNTGTTLHLLNQNVDTRTISVSLRPSVNSATTFTYTKATSSVSVNATSNVYFLFETNDGTYDIQFGDGRLGRNLSIGQEVTVRYLDSRGGSSVGANTFTYAGNTLGLLSATSNVSIALNNVNIPAYGGAPRESIADIKRSAPSVYQTQGRIVTASDARAVILSEVPGIESVSVWGGEDNDPPAYGKMFVSLKPVNAIRYGSTQKDVIVRTVLRPKSLPTMTYELVDPEYVYVVVDTQVRYTPATTALTAEALRQAVVNTISSYAATELGQFGSYFRYSQLVSQIDDADVSIQNNLTVLQLEKRITVTPSAGSYAIAFSNPVYQPATTSNVISVTSRVGVQRFTHVDASGIARRGCYLENEGSTLHVYRDEASGARLLTKSTVGTVNFTEGTLTLASFYPTSITTNLINELRIRVIPRNSDLVPSRQQIILIPSDNITVQVVEDLLNRTQTTFGRLTAGGRLGAGSFSS